MGHLHKTRKKNFGRTSSFRSLREYQFILPSNSNDIRIHTHVSSPWSRSVCCQPPPARELLGAGPSSDKGPRRRQEEGEGEKDPNINSSRKGTGRRRRRRSTSIVIVLVILVCVCFVAYMLLIYLHTHVDIQLSIHTILKGNK